MDLNQIHILDLEIPHNIHRKIMSLLAEHHWFKAFDKNRNEDKLKTLEQGRSLGWAVQTMDNNKFNSPLDLYADFIFQVILKKLNISGTLDRCLWNLYFPGDAGDFHIDRDHEGYLSAVYPLHTTDGLTIINDQEFKDTEGFAKIFQSHLKHKGIGPQNSKFRMNLNLVIKLS